MKEKLEMRWIHIISMLVLIIQAGYTPCPAQQFIVVPGSKVRIKAPSVSLRQLEGTVVTVSVDTFALRTKKSAAPLMIPTTSIKKLELLKWREWSHGQGALTGFGAGVVVGLAFGLIAEGGGNWGSGEFFSETQEMLAGAGLFGAIGLVAGAIIGVPVDRWEEIPLDYFGIGLSSQRTGRVMLSAAFRF